MSPRTDQLERTRTAILEAAIDVIFQEEDQIEFTMQAIADRAGVSHRTLYRHFEDRQALINAAGAQIDATLGEGWSEDVEPTDLDRWISGVGQAVAFGIGNRDMLRRANAISVTTGVWRTDRDDRYWDWFRGRFPNLDENQARQDFAMLRHANSAANVVFVGERFGLSPEDLVQAMQRTVQTLIESIRTRDDAARTERR